MRLSPGSNGPLLALAAALLFGASTPAAKLMLGTSDPLMMAGVLYLSSGIGLTLLMAVDRVFRARAEAPLRGHDAPWLLLVVLFGGVLGPALLMHGLAAAPAATGSLLLNTESLATMAIAWLVFRENVDGRIFAGAMAILGGALLLAWPNTAAPNLGWGSLLIVGACVCWGIDNNLTRKLSAADPVQIAAIKGLAAGVANTALALGHGATIPSPAWIAGAATVGVFGYGISLVLFMLGLRQLGTARAGAYFATAPFIGAALSVPLFGDPLTPAILGAAGLMGIGVYLHLTEMHAHEHVHEDMEHEHRHMHDVHHQHAHGSHDPLGEPHSHSHAHARLVHKHPHYPDLHHRHRHA